MKLIVGLGNPGRIYIDSRHNIGSALIKAMARGHGVALKRDKGVFSLSAKSQCAGKRLVLAIPLTFMNLSGIGVSSLLKKYKIGLGDLLVVCDDLDLELGRIRIRSSGSSGGHRGLQSIIDSLGSQDFARLRIGIDRPPKNLDAAEYVLSPFSKREKVGLKDVWERALICCEVWATKGIIECMGLFNKKS